MGVSRAGYLLLDAVAGWRGVLAGLGESGTERTLALEPLPGVATPLFGATAMPAGEPGPSCGPTCPAGIAVEGCGRLLVADAARQAIDRLDVARGITTPLREIGGPGSAPRRFREPRGVALTPSGGLAVADTGNHRVQVFSRAPYVLRHVWGATDDRGRPVAGNGPGEFNRPWGLAIGPCGTAYVVDRGNHRVQVFGADGAWRREFGSDVLTDPTRIALGPDGTLAVIDGTIGASGRTSQLCLFPCRGEGVPTCCLLSVTNPRSVTFGAGRLYVGDAVGLIHVFDPDATAPGGYSKIGEGVTGLAGAVSELAWDASIGLVAIIREDDETGVRLSLRRIDPAAGCVHQGTLVTNRIDSGLDHCHWHRAEISASLPSGTRMTAEAIVCDDVTYDPAADPAATWGSWELTGDDPDFLFPSGDAGTGRYLWLRLTVNSDGDHNASLSNVKLYYPRTGYLPYMPAVYQEDDESRLFLERFLAIFQTEFDGFDGLIDTLWMRLLDPSSADARFLPWLAAWLALTTDPTWGEAKLRAMIKGAFASYRVRGTVAGLEGAIRAYGGVPWGMVLEHYRLRRWPVLSVDATLDGGARLWSADIYRRLRVGRYSEVGRFRLTNEPEPAVEPLHWGANRFSVFFPADPLRVDDTRGRVAAVVEREKPAHTQATLCPVFPRFRVGVQARVGVDSVVGGISPLVLNRLATLGYDSVLSGSAFERQVRRLGTSPRPRVGVSLKLP
jgi:phage tail-like protein